MKLTLTLFLAVVFICFCAGCHKDYSYEGGTLPVTAAIGSLKDSANNCQAISINGQYQPGLALTASNNIVVTVTITQPGSYTIGTDTVNGCWFSDIGTITKTGAQTITITGHGTPATNIAASLTVRFSGTACSFTIPVSTAAYTFNAPAGSCPAITVHGSYQLGIGLGPADTVTVPITVTMPGSYNLQTPMANGIQFAASGIFTASGNYNIKLTGSGTPTAVGNFSFPLTVANRTCSFNINVDHGIDTTLYWQFTAEGITYKGYLDSAIEHIGPDVLFHDTTLYNVTTTGVSPDSATVVSNFVIGLIRVNHDITTGLYYPTISQYPMPDYDFTTDVVYADWRRGISYSVSPANLSFTVNLTSFGQNTRLVQGSFSGPANNAAGQIVNITNGFFKTYLAH